MSFRLKVFIVGSCITSLLIGAVFLFIPKQKSELIINTPLSQSVEK